MPLEGMTDTEFHLVERAVYRLANRQAADKLWRDYYDGDHRLAFATDKFRSTFGAMFAAFADNLCPAVVDAVADRLHIEGFSPDSAGDDQAMRDLTGDIWRRNRMPVRAGEVHTEALRQGDATVLVWSDDQGKAVLWPQRSDMMVVEYDPDQPGQVSLAVKAWRIDTKPDGSGGKVRLNVYTATQVLKFVTKSAPASMDTFKASSTIPWQVPGEPWPLTHDLGRVPVVPFVNNAATGSYGFSELRDVLPLQDALNKSVADMMVAMEYVAMPQRWATGVEIPTDPDTGKPVESFRPGVDRLWSVVANDAKFGEFPQADLTQFLKVQDGFRAEVARVSATPFHYLMLTTGEFPSGEAMKTAEQRFVSKVRDRQAGYGQSWSDVMALALTVEGKQDAQVAPAWREAQTVSEKEHLEGLKVKSELGVPKPTLWREMGYTEDEVGEMEIAAEARRATLAESMSAALNAGE